MSTGECIALGSRFTHLTEGLSQRYDCGVRHVYEARMRATQTDEAVTITFSKWNDIRIHAANFNNVVTHHRSVVACC
jgi:hypothetical protein